MNNDLTKGLIITYPYATYIIDYKKTIIVKSRKFSNISNQKMLLIETKIGLSTIELEDPYEIDLKEFKKLYKYHLITEKDRITWWPEYKKLYVYKISYIKLFNKPILLDYKTGPQVVVNMHNIIIKKMFIGVSGFIVKPIEYKTNSVEVNTTFYKFPTKTLIQNLSKYDLVYSIKVSQIITHFKQLENVDKLWKTFYNLFEPIKSKIKCFLFQFSEKFIPNKISLDKIKKFSKLLDKEHHYVFEFRNTEWFNKKYIDFINKLNLHFCSLYSFDTELFTKYKNIFYIRLHGTKEMYKGSYNYDKLAKIYDYIKNNQVHESYIYFNNTDDDSAIKNSLTFYNKFNNANK